MSESGAKGMGEVRDPFTAEELYELRREDLNEFTSEDERMPSPKDVRAEETIVLPEIQTTGYIRQHYEALLVDEIFRRLRYGELCVRHGGKLYRECPWTGPEDYPEEDDDDVTVLLTPIEHQCSVSIHGLILNVFLFYPLATSFPFFSRNSNPNTSSSSAAYAPSLPKQPSTS